jgi:hypothetical protein
MIVGGARIVRIDAGRHPHSFFNFAVPLVFPDQQIGDSSWIIETTSHKTSRDDRNALAVDSRPETNEVQMPSAPLFSLLHRRIPSPYFSANPNQRARFQDYEDRLKGRGLHFVSRMVVVPERVTPPSRQAPQLFPWGPSHLTRACALPDRDEIRSPFPLAVCLRQGKA